MITTRENKWTGWDKGYKKAIALRKEIEAVIDFLDQARENFANGKAHKRQCMRKSGICLSIVFAMLCACVAFWTLFAVKANNNFKKSNTDYLLGSIFFTLFFVGSLICFFGYVKVASKDCHRATNQDLDLENVRYLEYYINKKYLNADQHDRLKQLYEILNLTFSSVSIPVLIGRLRAKINIVQNIADKLFRNQQRLGFLSGQHINNSNTPLFNFFAELGTATQPITSKIFTYAEIPAPVPTLRK